METNQAFEILQKSGGIRAAKIITQTWKKLPLIRVLFAAYQLRRGVPVAKIINKKWFYGLPFYTNKCTLDPRPDTETIVEAVLKEYKNKENIKILDLGTGTGCLIASITKNTPGTTGIGIDKSWHACRVARKNIHDLGLDEKVKILHDSFTSKKNFGQFDVIVSNPPYIANGDPRIDTGAKHDPKMALYARKNGLAAYESIAKNAKRWLKLDGKIYLEIGDGQGSPVRKIFETSGWIFINSFYDLSEIERVLCFKL